MARRFTDEDFLYSSLGDILEPTVISKFPIKIRLEVSDLQFTIIENQNGQQTLFNALSQALVGSQLNTYLDQIHKESTQYIVNQAWEDYKDIIKTTLDANIKELQEKSSEKKIKNKKLKKSPRKEGETKDYREIYSNYSFSKENKGSMFELCAAAEIFHFTFGVMVLSSGNVEENTENSTAAATTSAASSPNEENLFLHIYNCTDQNITHNSLGAKYYFLQSGSESQESWEWNYLEPNGELFEIPDGVYEVNFKKVIEFPKSTFHHHFNNAKKKPTIGQPPSNLFQHLLNSPKLSLPVVLEHKGREFFYRASPYDDETLFSLLNHFLFDSKSEMRLQIQILIAKKRQEVSHLVEPTPERNTKGVMTQSTKINLKKTAFRYFNYGHVIDLRIAASIFAFTYELFGLDDNMNLYYSNNEHVPSNGRSEVLTSRNNGHLVLFVKTVEKDFGVKWYRLQESPIIFWNKKYVNVISNTINTSNTDYTTAENEEEEEENESTDKFTRIGDFGDTDSAASSSITSNSSTISSINEINDLKLSVFKSIPILIPIPSKKSDTIWNSLKNIYKSPTTKTILIPKKSLSEHQNKFEQIHQVSYNLAKHIHGNLPQLTSIPDTDYYMTTIHQSNPSSQLPLIAYLTSELNEIERRGWTRWNELAETDADTETNSETETDSSFNYSGGDMNENEYDDNDIENDHYEVENKNINVKHKFDSLSKNLLTPVASIAVPRPLRPLPLHSIILQYPLNLFRRFRNSVTSTVRVLFGPMSRRKNKVEPLNVKEHQV